MGADLSKLAVKRLARGLRMNFERVLCPFLLLHVNRYAGRGFDPDCFQKAASLPVPPGPGGTDIASFASASAGATCSWPPAQTGGGLPCWCCCGFRPQ